ncbi:MAG: hypothetical protein ACK449_01760 [Planctomycetota bacterium]|jgi:hypothetical protein
MQATPGEHLVWDTIRDQFLIAVPEQGNLTLDVPADDALVLVFVPKGALLVRGHGRLIADEIIVDYGL